MSPKRPIVVISSIDWDAPWQRHQIFASQFSDAGHEVFFIENSGFRNPGLSDISRVVKKARSLLKPRRRSKDRNDGVRLISPKVLPPTQRLLRNINRRLLIPRLLTVLRDQGLSEDPIVIVYFPTATSIELVKRLSPSAVIYDCASNFRAHPSAPKDIRSLERELLKLSQLVVCDSDFLYSQKKTEHKNVLQIHQGVSPTFFNAAPPSRSFNRALYYGTWSPDLDTELIKAVVDAGLDVTISGYTKGPEPDFPPSVRRLKPIALEKLLGRLENYDVMLMPYKITPFHLGVVPAKTYECLAMGRPVIATPLPSLKRYKDHIHIAETPQQWARIAAALASTENPEKRRARIALAREHTYEKEFTRFSRAVIAAADKA